MPMNKVRNSGKEPRIKPIVTLVGSDSNAIAIIDKTCRAMVDLGQKDLVDKYTAEATSGSYHNLLKTTLKYVEVE